MIDTATLAMMKGPEKPPATTIGEEGVYYKNRLPSEKNANLRDTLSVILANKLAQKDAKKYLGDIAFSIGDTDKTGAIKDQATYDKARALLSKVIIFNQRSDVQQLSPKDRLTTFFDMYKGDKEVGDIVTTLRSFGSGVEANYNDSPLAGLGRFPLVASAAPMSKAQFAETKKMIDKAIKQ